MGGLGSDVAIETADVIIHTDQPSKIARAIQIGRSARRIFIAKFWFGLWVKNYSVHSGCGQTYHYVGSRFRQCGCDVVRDIEYGKVAENAVELN